MTRMLALFATVPLLAQAVSAVTVEHWWNISYAVANPDGVGIPYSQTTRPLSAFRLIYSSRWIADASQLFERRVIGVNGSWPLVFLS